MNEIHSLLRPALAGDAAIIALFAAALAALSSRRRPQRTAKDLMMFTVTVLSAAILALTIGLMIWFLSRPCADSVCDAGAMAAAGVVMLGAVEVIIVFAVGAPAAYLTIRFLRGR
jgi:hypothetical protein